MALCTTGECSCCLGSFSAGAESEVYLGSKGGLVGFSSVLAFMWLGEGRCVCVGGHRGSLYEKKAEAAPC